MTTPQELGVFDWIQPRSKVGDAKTLGASCPPGCPGNGDIITLPTACPVGAPLFTASIRICTGTTSCFPSGEVIPDVDWDELDEVASALE